jgi:hypothetical protein
MAQTAAAPTVHIRNRTVSTSHNKGGCAWAACSIVASNLPNHGVTLTYKSNLKTFNPGTLGPWRTTSGTVSISGDSILALEFGFKGKTAAQVAKSLKVTIATQISGVTITDGTARAIAPTSRSLVASGPTQALEHERVGARAQAARRRAVEIGGTGVEQHR